MARVKCPICGKRVASSVTVCPDCGAPVESGPAAESIKQAHNIKNGKKPQRPLVAAIFSPFIIIYILIFLFAVFMIGLTVHSFIDKMRTGYDNDDVDDFDSSVYVEPDEDEDHNHLYQSVITRQATCTTPGERTFTCDCGHSYVKSIATTPHNYSAATCSSPRKCSVCGATSVSPLTHSYMQGKCLLCGGADPAADSALSRCSLSLPALPKTVKNTLGGQTISTLSISKISHKFTYEATGGIGLTLDLTGTITDSPWGAGQNTVTRVGWKLYGPDGQLFKTGTMVVSGRVGNEFTSKGNNLLYSFDNAPAGSYRLELSDTQ